MSLNVSTPWHKASFERFLHERLPQLLADRLPLVGYQAGSTGRYKCRVVVTLTSASNGDVEIEYGDLPQPDEEGLLEIKGELKLVIPTAAHERLDVAEMRCVGEQLYDYVHERLGEAPPDLPWDAALARVWLPLDTWVHKFMCERAQTLDARNWLSRHTHLRRILIPDRERVIAPGQFGRVCPFELPEGPNIGRVFTVAVGAEIREGRLAVVDERPEAGLGLSASMIPFLEHSDSNRLLMGANMMRQWIVPPDPEPALVQTGHEPHAPGFWGGRNLLTAFVSWGADTFSDGIVISASCAQRLNAPYPAEPGDKLSNRHGTKGVVSRVLPDEDMPHLSDGTPVELLFNFGSLHMRLNFGQIREALMGRIAQAEGQTAIVPPFYAPDQDELRERLASAGLPASGMETLTLGRGGPKLERPSAVGWVYWGRTMHLSRGKVMKSVHSSQRGQMQGVLENCALRNLGAHENMAEYLNTRAIRREDADTLATRVAAGSVEQAAPPTPMFADLVERLLVAGIDAALEGGRLAFRFEPPQGDALKLARPLPHPWLRERELTEIGAYPALDEYAPLAEANARLARMLVSQTPQRLLQDAQTQLETRLQAFFDALLTPTQLLFRERQLFSARAVIAPGADLRLDQVGLPHEIAWALFGPLVVRKLGDEEAVRARTEEAAQTLDGLMARAWLIVNRAPTLSPTALLAFHPLRDPAPVVRIHPLVCAMLDADFDGDQVAVMLPLTAGAQREAGERLAVAAHLARDPSLLEALLPPLDALWGLASLSLTEEGRREIAQLAPGAVPNGLLTRTSLLAAAQKVLERDGVEAVLEVLERLMRRGFEVAQASGASMSPFLGAGLSRPPEPGSNDPEAWDAYAEALAEQIASNADYASADLGPQLLAVKCRERGLHHLTWLTGSRGTTLDVHGKAISVRRGYVDGLTPQEMYASVSGAREALAELALEWERLGQVERERGMPAGLNVLARARRSKRPGIVFARAAASGEVDPLVDVDGRLLVGLPVTA
jgi:hypothetical protein